MRTAAAKTIRTAETDAPLVKVPGYRIGAPLYQSVRASIYRATRERDGVPVILKVLQEHSLTAENIACYRHEYEILQHLQSPGVVKAYDLKHEPAALALVIEDCGGVALKEIIDARDPALTLAKKLALALKLVAALRDVHAANVIHKDINPNNVVVNIATDELRLIDFGMASSLPREQAAETVPTLLLGTLAYIAPEQTGRMNRVVDYRSDFYSLGATLYELFTGRVPFAGSDPLELIHGHIARAPTPPCAVDAKTPESLSAIIVKLLAKTAEERYQSIWSLEADLQRCLTEWQTHGAVAPFAIDQLQISDRFQLPQKLYGREADLQTLLAAFDRAGVGKPEVLFVTGPSGIGKTSLVREVYKPITAKRGFFVAGKFDQFQRNIPYSAVLNALRELIRQLLSEDETRIAHWRTSLQQALGVNARVLVDLLPELGLIIGEPAAVPAVGSMETQERLLSTLCRLLETVCRPEHPLVLYLDDLQWADSASLGMLQHVLTDSDLGFFLFIGSYRDNEVDPAHPIMLLREHLRRSRVAVSELALSPLTPAHIERLISDALGVLTKEAARLGALVHAKTRGNPYFVDEFLKSLHAKHHLYFDPSERRWRWDAATIESQNVTDNVVDLMAQNIRELKETTQELLRLAACIGNSFSLQMLGSITSASLDDVAAGLQDAIVAGLILPHSQSQHWFTAANAQFRFAHDRVQQAAYHLIPNEERAKIHYRIGRLLSAKRVTLGEDKDLLQIVNHLNAGRSEATPEERLQFAEWNLSAGRQAKASAAYAAAFGYFKIGIELLGDNSWNERYDIALALNTEAAEMAPLCNDTAELEQRFAAIRTHARTALDKIPVYETKLAVETRRGDASAATVTGLEALRLLGVRFPSKPNAAHLLYYTARAKVVLWGHTPESLLDHPRMTDPIRIAESRVLLKLCTLFYGSNRELLILALYRFVYLCVKFGNSDAAPSVYANYAMTLCAGKEIEKGYRFGRLALALADKPDAKSQRPWVSCMMHSYVEHWKAHARQSLPALLETYRQALDVGDMNAAGVALMFNGFMSFHIGETLSSLDTTLQTFIETLKKTVKDKRSGNILELYRDAIACLAGTDESKRGFSATDLSAEAIRQVEKKHPYTFHFFKGFLAFHFGDYEQAYQSMQQSRKHAHTVVGILRFGDLYDGLSRIMVHPTLPKEQQKENLESIRRIKARLKIFAKDGLDNYLHRWHLLEAEFERLQDHAMPAMEHYEDAIEAARLTGHVHEEALANELAGRYYLSCRKSKVAQSYMTDARALYLRWGAIKKVEWLDTTYPQFHMAAAMTHGASTRGSSQAMSSLNLDFPALMKALKMIAEETVHSQILEKTIQIVMQFAGAEKALLLLRDTGDALLVEADADTARGEPELLKSIPLADSTRLCQGVANYARRTKTSVVIHDAGEPQALIPGLQNDRYVRENHIKSILCIPISSGGRHDAELIGLVYVENNASSHAFTEQRVEILELICLSVAGRLELSRKAVTDSLTGLYNRGYFQNTLSKELAAARRKQRPLSLVLIDIDHFKKVNDNWGHQVGDAVLKHVAKILKVSCRDSDVVARYGGEEMILILPETNSQQATDVAERIRRTLEEQSYVADKGKVIATASLGVATNSARLDTPESLIKAADDALYRSKAEGRNRVTVA